MLELLRGGWKACRDWLVWSPEAADRAHNAAVLRQTEHQIECLVREGIRQQDRAAISDLLASFEMRHRR